MKKLFIAAMALATIVSCSKDDAGDAVLESSKKAISITIANAVPATRAVPSKDAVAVGGAGTIQAQEGNQAAASTDELVVLFANKGGNVVEAIALKNGDVATDGNVANDANAKPDVKGKYTYTFHNVHESVTQVAVVRYAAYQITEESNPFVGKNLSFFAEAAAVEDINVDLDALELYGSSDITTDGATCNKTDEHTGATTQYKLYTAEVTVAPKLARVEIVGISCIDLGKATLSAAQGNNVTGGFDEINLKEFSFGANGIYTYSFGTKAEGSETVDYGTAELLGVYNKTSENGTVNTRTATNWIAGSGQAIAWNIAPVAATFPTESSPMKLTMDVKAYDYTVSTPSRELHITNLTGATKFTAGNIYRFEIPFSESNLEDVNEDICVEVTVTVTNWVVVEVRPEFGNE